MTEAIAFDTHRYVKRLIDGGFTERQAETLIDAQVTLLNANLATKGDVARIEERIARIEERIAKVEAGMDALRQETKADIARIEERIAKIEADMDALRQETKAGMDALRQETKASVEIFRQETKASIEAIKSDLLKWLFGAMIAQGGLIVALVKLL
ncbi:MAG: DUF2730 family protein [Rhodospirillaceae bacterium]|nr:DUF2730 family protein [Rhodospirillaceae bacterium]